jgi:hypothetical protein
MTDITLSPLYLKKGSKIKVSSLLLLFVILISLFSGVFSGWSSTCWWTIEYKLKRVLIHTPVYHVVCVCQNTHYLVYFTRKCVLPLTRHSICIMAYRESMALKVNHSAPRCLLTSFEGPLTTGLPVIYLPWTNKSNVPGPREGATFRPIRLPSIHQAGPDMHSILCVNVSMRCDE